MAERDRELIRELYSMWFLGNTVEYESANLAYNAVLTCFGI
jgi:hypothetical protein